nr:PIN domain-containing protein [Roseofilum sp. Guam]
MISGLVALQLGKLLLNIGSVNFQRLNRSSIAQYAQLLAQAQFWELHITSAHALRAGNLPIKHRDPFDRMIMAQGELENIPIITYDRAFNTGLIQIIP